MSAVRRQPAQRRPQRHHRQSRQCRRRLVGGTLGGLGLTQPSAIPPTSPKAPAPADPNAGLIIGTGGLVGNVGQLIGPTTSSLFGGDGYLSNGNLKLSNANVMQTYSTVNAGPAGGQPVAGR